MKRPDDERRPILDPAVADLMNGMEKKQQSKNLTKKQKAERARMAKRNRVVIDIPPEIEGLIGAIAADRDVSVSGVIEIALREFIKANGDGHVKWADYLTPSRSPRFGFKVVPQKGDGV